MKKMTIFHLIQSNAVGGGMENVFLEYSKILQNHGFNLVCLVSENFCHIEALKQQNIKVELLNVRGHFDILAAIKLHFLINKYSPQLIIANNGRTFAVVNLCKKILGLKGAKTMAISHGGSIKRIGDFDYIVTVANHIHDKIAANGFKGAMVNIHNGHKISQFEKNSPNKSFTFGILSRLSKEKNVEQAIIAFKEFNDLVDKNSILIIGGEGKELDDLRLLTRNLNLEAKIKFIGWVEDRAKFFNQIDVFLQPALNEPFGITILEAFNYKTVVIAANNDGPKEIIQDDHSGYLFDLNDEQSLFLMMKKSYLEKDNAEKIINNATQDLKEKFSHEIMEQKLLDFVSRVE
jgi:glycosyltransferase involved in cell wall biosynthesis